MIMELSKSTMVSLEPGGVEMPILGLGTWKIEGKTAYKSVQWALEAGYRHIDTAMLYKNEKPIGKAVKDYEIDREELFITSKVWDDDQGYDSTLKACQKSLDRLQMDYLDLYLIHWPRKKRNETWRAMQTLLEEEKVRAIGVANFYIHHLEELLEKFEIPPAVNQFELNPFLYRTDLIEFCRSHAIAVEAYSPLTHGKKLGHSLLKELAEKYKKSPAQILIRWSLQHEFIVIPKSESKEHIEQNIEVFDFSLEGSDMEKLDTLEEEYMLLYDTSKWE